jgi:agmatine deiminase
MTVKKKEKTVAEMGYSMPAEWESHRATWIGWPRNSRDWPGKIAPIHWVYGEIVRHLSQSEMVATLVFDESHEAKARNVLGKVGVDSSRIEFHRIKHDRGWMRDSGPMFVKNQRDGDTAVVKFKFNAWAKYDDWKLDNKVAVEFAKRKKRNIFHASYEGKEVVLEGGAIDVNGAGTLLTTEECLLDKETQVRNPHLDKFQTEEALKQNLGVSNIIWLNKGIIGDDTHGHVDDFARFVKKNVVMLAEERNGADYNHRILEENRERLEGAKLENGRKAEIVRLPMPSPLFFDGQRLPASYANFYIGNEVVLVPTFNDEKDREALGIISEVFPKRRVIGIHAVDLVWGLGTIHCLTQQEPS